VEGKGQGTGKDSAPGMPGIPTARSRQMAAKFNFLDHSSFFKKILELININLN